MVQWLCMLFFLGIGIQQGCASSNATGTDARNLRKQLFETNGYDKKVRTALNQSEETGTTFSSTKVFVCRKVLVCYIFDIFSI